MTLKTVPVTGTLFNPDGSRAVGASVTATLTAADTDGGLVVPNSVSVLTDSNGVFTLSLWPNSRGVNGSQYRLRAQVPGALPGVLLANYLITVPDSDPAVPVPVENITNRRGPDALSDAKAAMLAAQTFATVTGPQNAAAAAQAVLASKVDAAALAATSGSTTVGFTRSGVNAKARTVSDKERDVVSVMDTAGVTGVSGTDHGVAVNNAIADAASRGACELFFPDGTYETSTPFVQLPGVTFKLSKLAVLKATAAMPAVVQGPSDQMLYRVGVYGGVIDCNGLADVGYDPQFFQHLTVEDLTVENFLVAGVRYGLPGTPSSSYEHMTRNLRTFRPSATVPTGSIALHVRAASDGQVIGGILEGAEIGTKVEMGGNVFIGTHAWTRGTTGQLKIAVWDTSFGNTYIGFYADTPTQIGFQLDGRRYSVLGCRVYIGPDGGASDNVTVAVKFASTDPQSAVIGLQCEGSSSVLRIAQDIDYSSVSATNSLELMGNLSQKNVSIIAPTIINKLTSLNVNGGITVAGSVNCAAPLISSGAAGTNARGLTMRSSGVDRLKIRLDTAAESGGNSGSNGEVVRYDDTGAYAGTPLTINRASGQISMTDAGVTVNGTYNKPLTTSHGNLWMDAGGLLRIKSGAVAPASDADGYGLKNYIGTYTWSALMALTGVPTGAGAIVSDLNNREMVYDGTRWRPPGGILLLASSGVAATALTGTTAETTSDTIKVPGGLLGTTGSLRITIDTSGTNNANVKTLKAKLGGTPLFSFGNNNFASWSVQFRIRNRGVANSQFCSVSSGTGFGTITSAPATSAIDTSVDQNLTFTQQLATATDTFTREGYTVEALIP